MNSTGHPSEVLDLGVLTICGPEEPARGSAKRLFGAIEDDSAAVFVQITTGGIEPISGVSCTTHAFQVINHPTMETLDETVAELAPQHVVIKLATGSDLNRFQKRYDECFTWGTNDSHEHTIYEEGKWTAPDWLTDRVVQKIRMRQWQALSKKSVSAQEAFPTPERTSVDLAMEGVAVEDLRERFASQSFSADSAAQTTGTSATTETQQTQSPTSEAMGDEPTVTSSADRDMDSFESTVLTQLDAIESMLETKDEMVTARVLSGDGQTFLQVLDDTELPPGQLVELQIRETTSEDDSSS